MLSSPFTAQGVVASGQRMRSGRVSAAARVVSCSTFKIPGPRVGSHFTTCGM